MYGDGMEDMEEESEESEEEEKPKKIIQKEKENKDKKDKKEEVLVKDVDKSLKVANKNTIKNSMNVESDSSDDEED